MGNPHLEYVAFTVAYFIWVIGCTFQTFCTRAGQTVLTNDPNQRPMFTIFNTVGSMLGMGVMQALIPMLKNKFNVYDAAGKLNTSGYARPELYRIITPIGITVSEILTILAIIGIAEKDRPEFFGIGYGAYYATADMPIPMVADCSDYETYRSGKYIPGIMGTLFSLVDKLL